MGNAGERRRFRRQVRLWNKLVFPVLMVRARLAGMDQATFNYLLSWSPESRMRSQEAILRLVREAEQRAVR